MNSGDVLRILRKEGPVSFVNDYLFDTHAACFPTVTGSEYEDVRRAIGDVFGASLTDIAVVGSAKYGFSLSPEKEFRKFDIDQSDIDIVVISKGLFNSTWKHLRTAYFNGEIRAKNMYQGDVFKRFFMVGTEETFDSLYLRDLRLLLDRTRRAASTRLGIPQVLKIRIYSSWSDAKSYHVWSIQKLGEVHGIQ